MFVEHTTQNKMWLEELAKLILLSQMEILREKWKLGAGTAQMDSAVGIVGSPKQRKHRDD